MALGLRNVFSKSMGKCRLLLCRLAREGFLTNSEFKALLNLAADADRYDLGISLVPHKWLPKLLKLCVKHKGGTAYLDFGGPECLNCLKDFFKAITHTSPL